MPTTSFTIIFRTKRLEWSDWMTYGRYDCKKKRDRELERLRKRKSPFCEYEFKTDDND